MKVVAVVLSRKLVRLPIELGEEEVEQNFEKARMRCEEALCALFIPPSVPAYVPPLAKVFSNEHCFVRAENKSVVFFICGIPADIQTGIMIGKWHNELMTAYCAYLIKRASEQETAEDPFFAAFSRIPNELMQFEAFNGFRPPLVESSSMSTSTGGELLSPLPDM